LPGPQGVVVVVIGCQNRFVDVPGISTGLNPRRARIAQVCEYVLEQREHAPEQDRQDGREFAMGHRVKVIDVRKEHGITVLTDLDVRGKPLELVRQRVARLVRAQARPCGVVRAAHPAHQAEQRRVNQVQDLFVRSRMPVPLRVGYVLQYPHRLAQPGP